MHRVQFATIGTYGRLHLKVHHKGVLVARITAAAKRFIRNDEGAALAEYGILIAFIAIAAIVAVTFFGSKIKQKFSDIGNTLS